MKRRQSLPVALLALSILASPCLAQDPDAAARKAKAAIEKYNSEVEAFRTMIMAAPADQRRELSKGQPDSGPAVAKAEEFIRTCPSHAQVPTTAGWLLSRAPEADRKGVFEILADHHLANPGLAEACLAVMYDRGPDGEPFLETVLEKAKEPEAKGAAAFVLATRLRRPANDEEEKKRAEYLKIAVKDLGDLEVRGRSIKAMAEGQLFAAENLAIGKTAPEIEGEDTEGVKIKLSDYRGKVVVLDFWGDW